MERIPIIFDCDTGTDDAVAIVSALYTDKLDIKAFTTTSGNTSIENAAQNTLNLVDYLGFDIKVAVGASKPIVRKRIRYGNVHGGSGLGDTYLPPAKRGFYEKSAVATIYEEAKKLQGELQLVCVGPLTNIAIALAAYPDLPDYIKHITIMGGAAKGGNATPTAEFNFFYDPDAARVVMGSGIPMTMVGLDVTEKTVISEDEAKPYKQLTSKAAKVIDSLLDFMMERGISGSEEAVMHDGLALASLVVDDLITTQDCYVAIETLGKYTAGHSFCDLENELGRAPNCKVALTVDALRYKQWLFDTIAKLG